MLADDVGGGFGLKNGVQRDEVAVIAASIDLGRPVKWIEDRLEHLAVRRSGPRGGRRHRGRGHGRRRAARHADRRQAQPRRLRMRPVQRCDLRRFAERRVPGPDAASRASPRSTRRCSATRRPTCRTGGRGRPVTSSASACSTSSRASSTSIRSTSAAATTSSADEPPLAMLTGQPFVGVTDPGADRAGGADRRLGRASGAARPKRGDEGRYLGIGMAAYLEAAPGPRIPGQEDMAAMIMGKEVTRTSRWSDDGRSCIVTRQQPHGQSHETTLAQVAVDELGVQVRGREGRVRRHRRHARSRSSVRAAAGRRRWRTARCCTRRASCASKILVARRGRARGERRRPRDQRRRRSACRARRGPAAVARARPHRGARSRSACPRDADTDLVVTHEYDGGQSGWSGGAHVAEVEVDVETGLVSDRRATWWSRTAGCRSTRRSSRARSAAVSRRRSARSSSSTRRTTTTVSSWRRRSWTT